MSENGYDTKLTNAVADALAEDGASWYDLKRREPRSGTRRGGGGPRPQEFDANGFPVPQPNTSFVQRVARLLDPRAEGEAR
jgi:hypothetical protein